MEKIIVLGTGSGMTVDCYSLSFLLQKNDEYLLVDTGSGNQILKQLKDTKININQIHDIFISHKHIDHLLGIFPLIRKICQEITKNNYIGMLNIYCDKEIKEIVDTFISSTFHKSHEDLFKKYTKWYFLEDKQKLNIIGYNVEVLDLYSKECVQYGFKIKLCNNKQIAFLGDVPCNRENYDVIKEIDWVLHEAMCLEHEDKFIRAREKNHSTVKDVAEIMQIMNVKNLVIWHTADNNIKDRKELYTNEAKKYFDGNVFVPNDCDIIEL